MSDITELERRLTAALDRISQNASNVATAPVDTGQMEELIAEKVALLERVDRLEDRAARLTDRLEDAEGENARLASVIEAMRAHTDALSEANIAGTSAGEEINSAMAAELLDLRAARKSDIAQMDEILAELAPAVKEA